MRGGDVENSVSHGISPLCAEAMLKAEVALIDMVFSLVMKMFFFMKKSIFIIWSFFCKFSTSNR